MINSWKQGIMQVSKKNKLLAIDQTRACKLFKVDKGDEAGIGIKC